MWRLKGIASVRLSVQNLARHIGYHFILPQHTFAPSANLSFGGAVLSE
jgi:hypothetical protein